jgi:uncharacterized protein
MKFTRERLIGITIALVFGCVAFVYGLRWLESAMTFRPARMTEKEKSLVPEGAESVWFKSADGTRLHGWFFETQAGPEIATVIFFHGNGGNIGNVGWVGQRFAQRGFDVLLFDYRGYGASDGVAANESDLYADGDAAVAFVRNEKGARPERIVLYGQSLGTAIVADVLHVEFLAAWCWSRGLVLQVPSRLLLCRGYRGFCISSVRTVLSLRASWRVLSRRF